MKEVIEKIKAAKSVALFPHINEDPDALCSCGAFCAVLKKMGKKAVCYVNEKPQEHFRFINIDYTIYDETKTYDHDLCLALDCGDIDRLGSRKKLFYEIGNSASIDHHKTNTYFADANYVEGGASSTGEILYRVFKAMGAEIDAEIARLLYIAISSDTGSFKYSNVTPATFRTAADLIEYDFDYAEAARVMFDTEALNVTRFKAELMQKIESYAGGKITAVTISDDMYEKYSLPPEEAPNIVDIPRCVEGSEIALAFKRKKDGIGVNFRSNGAADVAAISLKFGGGGHAKAAGCTVHTSDLELIKREVLEECITAVNNI
ncbi:MAG: bifunctional oligoribonuclease/PAP phosphatase NrnA [Firmicutes bacterium]|nr:bifunctional oligoribonuclease/PAP phosphatase NrnA [Bacillota bacterium]